ncbi:MAG: serine/threonine-protein kinase [Verrucomicrobiota bacterium]
MTDPNTIAAFEAPEPARLAPLFPGYEIEGLIATGGMGAVYKAVQLSLDRPVAIKILPREFGEDESFRANFEAEAKAMARLNHPNLIGVYDFGEVAGMLFIIMEFVAGKTLFHSAHGIAIAPEAAARIAVGVCQGLAHAHEHGILHRDIKPGNILLDQQARPKIGDFGLARPIGAAVKAGETIFGTPHYTAPEVLMHPNQVDARADIFSVGVVLHELLTGRLPAADTRPTSVICGCDARFDAVIRRATHPVPDLRYPSAAEMAKDLRSIAAATPAAAHAASPAHAPTHGKTAKRRVAAPAGARSMPANRRAPAAAPDSSGKIVNVVLLGLAMVAVAIFFLVPKFTNTTQPAPPPEPPVTPSAAPTRQTPPTIDRPSIPTPPSASAEPKPEPKPEPEIVKIEPLPPAVEPVIPAPAPLPGFDVPAFLDRARDMMRLKATPIYATSAKEIEKNYEAFERQIIYKVHQIDKDKQTGIKQQVDKVFKKWRAAGARVPAVLDLVQIKSDKGGGGGGRGRGGVDQEKDFFEKVTVIHAKFLAKQDKLDHDLETDLLELASTYVTGLTKQIERLTDPNEAPAVGLIRAEIANTQNRPSYFSDLMRGIDPDAPKLPAVDIKGTGTGIGNGPAPDPASTPAPGKVNSRN